MQQAQNPPNEDRLTALMSSIPDIISWLGQRLDYLTVIFIVFLQVWMGYDMWFCDISHPYAIICPVLVILLLVISMLRFAGAWDMDQKKGGKIWEVTAWSTFLSIAAFWFMAGTSFASNRIYWTVTDRDGNILQETEYSSTKPGYNASNPIGLSVKPIKKVWNDEEWGRQERTFFSWDRTVTLRQEIGDSTCEITYHVVLECDVIHDNIMAFHEKTVTYEAIDSLVAPYMSKVLENAKVTKDQCTLGRWIDVDTRHFDPRVINPKVHWTTARFTCGYGFKPIV